MVVQYVAAARGLKCRTVDALADAGRRRAPGCLRARMTTVATIAGTVATTLETARVAAGAGNLFNHLK